MSQFPNKVPPVGRLATMRIVWFALLFGQFIFLAMIVTGMVPLQKNPNPQPILVELDWIMLATLVPGAFAFRLFVFRRFQIDGRIPIPVYGTGNMIFWAACEGVSFAGMVFAIVNGSLNPTLPIIVIAMALQASTFPTAKRLYIP